MVVAVIEWGKVPWSLWAHVALTTGVMVKVLLTASPPAPIAPSIFYIVFVVAWNFFLLRAIRRIWLATVGLIAVSMALDLALGLGTWSFYLIGLTELGLLLHPATRRFFGRREAVPAT